MFSSKPNQFQLWILVFVTTGILLLVAVFAGGSGSKAAAQTSTSTHPATTAQSSSSASSLPTLYKIVHVTLSPSYSCRSAQDFAAGYANTALFLSDSSKNVNAPELVFDGACGSPDYFGVQMAGDDLSLITDYGPVALTDWATQTALFSTPQRVANQLAQFTMQNRVQVGHTYGVTINKSHGIRGLLYFTVTAYVPNQSVNLDYAVMDYQLLNLQSQSPGFDWNAKPH